MFTGAVRAADQPPPRLRARRRLRIAPRAATRARERNVGWRAGRDV